MRKKKQAEKQTGAAAETKPTKRNVLTKEQAEKATQQRREAEKARREAFQAEKEREEKRILELAIKGIKTDAAEEFEKKMGLETERVRVIDKIEKVIGQFNSMDVKPDAVQRLSALLIDLERPEIQEALKGTVYPDLVYAMAYEIVGDESHKRKGEGLLPKDYHDMLVKSVGGSISEESWARIYKSAGYKVVESQTILENDEPEQEPPTGGSGEQKPETRTEPVKKGPAELALEQFVAENKAQNIGGLERGHRRIDYYERAIQEQELSKYRTDKGWNFRQAASDGKKEELNEYLKWLGNKTSPTAYIEQHGEKELFEQYRGRKAEAERERQEAAPRVEAEAESAPTGGSGEQEPEETRTKPVKKGPAELALEQFVAENKAQNIGGLERGHRRIDYYERAIQEQELSKYRTDKGWNFRQAASDGKKEELNEYLKWLGNKTSPTAYIEQYGEKELFEQYRGLKADAEKERQEAAPRVEAEAESAPTGAGIGGAPTEPAQPETEAENAQKFIDETPQQQYLVNLQKEVANGKVLTKKEREFAILTFRQLHNVVFDECSAKWSEILGLTIKKDLGSLKEKYDVQREIDKKYAEMHALEHIRDDVIGPVYGYLTSDDIKYNVGSFDEFFAEGDVDKIDIDNYIKAFGECEELEIPPVYRDTLILSRSRFFDVAHEFVGDGKGDNGNEDIPIALRKHFAKKLKVLGKAQGEDYLEVAQKAQSKGRRYGEKARLAQEEMQKQRESAKIQEAVEFALSEDLSFKKFDEKSLEKIILATKNIDKLDEEKKKKLVSVVAKTQIYLTEFDGVIKFTPKQRSDFDLLLSSSEISEKTKLEIEKERMAAYQEALERERKANAEKAKKKGKRTKVSPEDISEAKGEQTNKGNPVSGNPVSGKPGQDSSEASTDDESSR